MIRFLVTYPHARCCCRGGEDEPARSAGALADQGDRHPLCVSIGVCSSAGGNCVTVAKWQGLGTVSCQPMQGHGLATTSTPCQQRNEVGKDWPGGTDWTGAAD